MNRQPEPMLTLRSEPEPHKIGGSPDRKAPSCKHYPVYIGASF